jgi:hypothetical protein
MDHIVYKIESNGRVAFNVPLTRESFSLDGFGSDVFESELKKFKWTDVRSKRDVLITETDWTQMPDAPLDDAKKAEFTAYRQALRDIPQTYSDPDAVVWPEKPTV